MGHWEWDLVEDKCLYCSAELARLHGLSVEEYMRRVASLEADLEFVHPDDRERYRHWASSLLGRGPEAVIEYRMLPARGPMVHVREAEVAIQEEDGSYVRSVGFVQDVTKRVLAELELARAHEELEQRVAERTAELRKRELLFRQCHEIAHLGFCFRSPAEDQLTISQGLMKILQLPAGEDGVFPYDEFVTKFVHPDDQELVMELETLTPEGRYEVEYRLVRQDGEVRLVREVGEAVVDEEGAPLGEAGIVQDITEQRQVEAQLRQVQKMEAVGQLTGGVAHDFNNMLTAIIGNAELLLSDDLHLADRQREEVEEILKASERAAALTQQLLAFSRRQMLTPKVLDLNASVAEVQKLLRRLIGEDVEVITELDSALGSVKADPAQVGQVIMNLAINARDAMPDGGQLRIATANLDVDEADPRSQEAIVPGRYVMLVVSDTGRGIDEETRERIFEPFYTTKDTGAGTGLGLSTVYGIVKQSDGFINVDSEPGHGTTFKIYLPRVDEITEPLEPGSAPATLLQGTETVLLVEDEEPVRTLVRTVLERNGYRVLEAPGGPEAIEIAERHEGPINLLLTDVVMPKMSGLELAERLTTLSPQLKVLYISGYAEEVLADRGLSDQGRALLQKPFTPGALTHRLRELLDFP